jgi:hypothetical protein
MLVWLLTFLGSNQLVDIYQLLAITLPTFLVRIKRGVGLELSIQMVFSITRNFLLKFLFGNGNYHRVLVHIQLISLDDARRLGTNQ